MHLQCSAVQVQGPGAPTSDSYEKDSEQDIPNLLQICIFSNALNRQFKTPSSGGWRDFWLKGVSLILDFAETFFVLFSVSMIFAFFNFFWFFATL